jgi:hypothetical protein
MALPAGANSDIHDDSTLDKDVFDGIEDIYADLEANPPPAPSSSKNHILEAQRLNLSSSSSSDSDSESDSSIGINKNVSNEVPTQNEDQFSYLCGIHSPENSPKLTKILNMFKAQNYFEMQDTPENISQDEPPPETRVIENDGEQVDEVDPEMSMPEEAEMEESIPEEQDAPNTVVRDTIIQHTIEQDEASEEEVKNEDSMKDKITNMYQNFVDDLRQKNLLGVSEENDGVSNDLVANTSIQSDLFEARLREDKIREEKLKKYYPSFWDILGQRKLFGVSYRLLLLVFLNLFAFLLLVILVARFNTRKEADSNSLIDASTNAPTIASMDDDNNISTELIALCDEEGVTIEDGIILTANQVLEKGDYFCSPSKTYLLGMVEDLAIVDIRAGEVVWAAGVAEGARTILQANGDLIIEDEFGRILWNTGEIEGDFSNAQLVFWENNEGMIAVQQTPTASLTQKPNNFWMDGVPEVELCDDCQTNDLEFPVRGTFYLPTFDNTERSWQDSHFPSLGYYSSSDPDVINEHVEAMEYGKIDLAISFWEGAGTNFDRSRISMLLEETRKQNAALKWTISYETERRDRLDLKKMQSDLEYLKKWFVWHSSWAHIDGRPVIYVDNDGGCDAAESWMSVASDWYVVLRIFDGYESCEYQPDSWYEQRVNDRNDGIDIQEGLYYNLAPGQWRRGSRRPDLERLSPSEWCENVRNMVESNEQWQNIVSFNDFNLNTSIEPSVDWRSETKYGYYLDCLHDPQMF